MLLVKGTNSKVPWTSHDTPESKTNTESSTWKNYHLSEDEYGHTKLNFFS